MDGTDPACATERDPCCGPGSTVTKTASAAATTPGGPIAYTITATNTGQTPYPAAVCATT